MARTRPAPDTTPNLSKDTANKAPKRKRRRKARTDVSSSSESSSSSSSSSESGSEVEVRPKKVKGDKKKVEDEVEEVAPEVEMEDAPALHNSDSDDSSADESSDETAAAEPKTFAEKGGRIPSPLRDFHDPEAAARFEEYYLRLVTSEFGDELDTVRQAKDFGDRSLPMLVRALRQGINIFDTGEKRIAVGEKAAE